MTKSSDNKIIRVSDWFVLQLQRYTGGVQLHLFNLTTFCLVIIILGNGMNATAIKDLHYEWQLKIHSKLLEPSNSGEWNLKEKLTRQLLRKLRSKIVSDSNQ